MFWEVPTTLGFGGLACWVGYLAGVELVDQAQRSGDMEPSVLVATAGACLGGALLGRRIGKEADVRLSEGEEVSTTLRRGVQLGTVLSGATLTSLLGLVHASQREGEKTGVVAAWAIAGGALGAVAQIALNPRLHPASGGYSISLRTGPAGRMLFGLKYRF
jgi:hypothetical protein